MQHNASFESSAVSFKRRLGGHFRGDILPLDELELVLVKPSDPPGPAV